MTDKFSILSLRQIAGLIINQYDTTKEILGIPEELFFIPKKSDPFRSFRYGQLLESPIGVAAGPHTQLAQNIVAAWLTGARYIELKTIQTLDELEVSKPCIDMQDEGYNCEWSQELKINQSIDQYLNAWILIHILKDKLDIGSLTEPGFIFNMSVGYDYEGILKDNVQFFFNKMENASEELKQKIDSIKVIYPRIEELKIASKLSDNITLSTMHGCPPDEIEKIGHYLLTEKKLHTTIKLNPTLLGKEQLHSILRNSGFNTQVPDIAFEHDLKYNESKSIISNLSKTAENEKLHFGLKLTNTLESLNHKNVFPPGENMMYMSGRALHPISVNLAKKLQTEFDGRLDISFSAGADAFNVTDILSCGMFPVTVSSDILKPGGYGRLNQYLENIRTRFLSAKATSIEDFVLLKNEQRSYDDAIIQNLGIYAQETLDSNRYKKTLFTEPSIKTSRELGSFDCIHAPCTDTCPTNQDIPDYMYYTAQGKYDLAFDAILKTNPFPNVTGMVCDHPCQLKCTRINYDEPLQIRDIKRFVAEMADKKQNDNKYQKPNENNISVAIIGAGLSGLTCGYILRKAGFKVNIYESKDQPGGMAAGAIPSFRLNNEAFRKDLARINKTGIKIHYNHPVDKHKFEELRKSNQFVYIAAGAQETRKLDIEKDDLAGVLDPLNFLFNLKAGHKVKIGKNIAIIGGGNTAMDVARAAIRLVGENGKVTIIYRRTKKQMPADQDEILSVIDEGVEILELTHPVKINGQDSSVRSLTLIKMELKGKDSSGRPKPVRIENSEFDIMFDTIIPCIGQDQAFDFIDMKQVKAKKADYETGIEDVFIGGDAYRGASTAINAVGDGRKIAELIIKKANKKLNLELPKDRKEATIKEHKVERTKRIYPEKQTELPFPQRMTFDLITETLTEEQAVKEASRCLACDEVCNICTTVCPNLALQSYQIEPAKFNLQKIEVRNGIAKVVDDEIFEIIQKYQILHIADWCNECGNCTTFCPSSGSPYKEKPHLYLNKESFDDDTDCYFYQNINGIHKLEYKDNETVFTLSDTGSEYIYQTDSFKININRITFKINSYEIKESSTFDYFLEEAAEMRVIMEGAKKWNTGK